MTNAGRHTNAILASKVKGTAVFNTAGEKIGHVEDIMLEKTTNAILFAVLGFGGLLGIGEKYHPVPWSELNYDTVVGGYVVPMTTEALERAPTFDLNDLSKGNGTIQRQATDYYASL